FPRPGIFVIASGEPPRLAALGTPPNLGGECSKSAIAVEQRLRGNGSFHDASKRASHYNLDQRTLVSIVFLRYRKNFVGSNPRGFLDGGLAGRLIHDFLLCQPDT